MWPRWLGDQLRPDQADAELDEELRFHVDRLSEELTAAGTSPEEARRKTRLAFGGVEQVKEECRDVRSLRWLEALVADLRYGWRSLRRTRGFTLVAAGSLAIGIGASSAIFSVADAVLLRTLPLPEPERLVELEAVFASHEQTNLESVVFDHLRDQREPFVDLFATMDGSLRLRGGPGPSQPTSVLFVSGGYFRILGSRPALGRLLDEADDRPAAPPVAVLSLSFWRRQFGGRPDVIGRTLLVSGCALRSTCGGTAVTIVGVAAPGFVGIDRSFSPDLFMPVAYQPPTQMLWIAGRLRPGVSIASAEARLTPLYRRGIESMRGRIGRWPAEEQREFLAQRLRLLPAGRGTAGLRWRMTGSLKLLAGAALLVLAIACTNVAALQLSRGERRVPEIAVRSSLGAGRGRVARQLLTESTLVACLGGAGALPVAFLLHWLLVRMSPLDPTALVDFHLDWRLFCVTAALSTVAGLVSGLLPALRLSSTQPYAVLKGERGATARWRSSPRLAILCGQVAVTLVLLAGASLLLHSLARLATVDAGFDRKHVLLVYVSAEGGRLQDTPAREWGSSLRERVAALPGVRSAALAADEVFGGAWIVSLWVDGHTYQPREDQSVAFNEVGTGFFETVGIPLLVGRGFLPSDHSGKPPVAVVSRAFARKYFGAGNAIGRGFRDTRRWYEIVGVVGDVRRSSLYEPPEPTVYLSIDQDTEPRPYPLILNVRTSVDAATLAAPIRQAVAGVDPELEVHRLQTVDEAVGQTLRRQRMVSTLMSLFAGVTLLLTALGLWGTIAYAVARRTAEIGVRMALGAGPRSIVQTILGDAALVLAVGGVIGLAMGSLALRSLRSLLFEVGPSDPLSLGGAVLGLVAVGLGAAALPAIDAARMAPMSALRHE